MRELTFRLPAPPMTMFAPDAFSAQVGEVVFVMFGEERFVGLVMLAEVVDEGEAVDLTVLVEEEEL